MEYPSHQLPTDGFSKAARSSSGLRVESNELHQTLSIRFRGPVLLPLLNGAGGEGPDARDEAAGFQRIQIAVGGGMGARSPNTVGPAFAGHSGRGIRMRAACPVFHCRPGQGLDWTTNFEWPGCGVVKSGQTNGQTQAKRLTNINEFAVFTTVSRN